MMLVVLFCAQSGMSQDSLSKFEKEISSLIGKSSELTFNHPDSEEILIKQALI